MEVLKGILLITLLSIIADLSQVSADTQARCTVNSLGLPDSSASGTAAVTRQDLPLLSELLSSEDQAIRDNAAKMLLGATAPMREYVKQNQPEVVKEQLPTLLSRFDEIVRDAAKILIDANPQASRYIYIFQAYCRPQYMMLPSRGDFLRFISPPKDHTGKWSYWHEDGALAIEETYKDGKLHGLTTRWRREQNQEDWKSQEMVYEHGKPLSSINWNRQGQEFSRNYWKDGAYFNNRFGWHENGTKKNIVRYRNSRPYGKWESWYDNGQKFKVENYSNGKRHGFMAVWHRNGQKTREGEYRNGKQQGLWVAWRENGQKHFEKECEAGKLKGRQITWNWDGIIVSEKQWNLNPIWGKVVEGLAVCLRPGKQIVIYRRHSQLQLDLRNDRSEMFPASSYYDSVWLEVDGKWYRPNINSGTIPAIEIKPGGTAEAFRKFFLRAGKNEKWNGGWSGRTPPKMSTLDPLPSAKPLFLFYGSHTVRAAFNFPGKAASKHVYAISNSVEIEFLPNGEKIASDTIHSRNMRQEMEKRDQHLRSQFQKIKTGMSPGEVRKLMGVEPKIYRKGFWGFELSPASDSMTERDVALQVIFKEGKVSKTDTSYTCIHVRLKD